MLKQNCVGRLFGRKAGMVARLLVTTLALSASIAISLTLLGAVQVHAAGVKETPTAANPWAVAFDSTGHIWVAEPGCDAQPTCLTTFPSYIGEFNRSDESLVKSYLEPKGYSSPVFLVVDKKNGYIWFTEPTTNAIGELIPGSTPTWKQWTVPTANAAPYDLLMDNNGNIWFTEFFGNKIGFFNPATKTFAQNKIATAASHPYGITMDIQGNAWFAENNAPKIGSFTPTTSGKVTIKEYSVNPMNLPHLITSDSKGNIWYSEGFSGYIGEFKPVSKTAVNVDVSKGLCSPSSCPSTHISGMGVDSKGNIWFDDSLSARVGYYNPASKTVKTLTLSNSSAHPYDGLAVDSQNNTWFTEEFGGPTGMLGEVPAGTI